MVHFFLTLVPTESGGQLRAYYLSRILNHLFAIKNLKPATTAGYRAAIADHFGQEVSKCLNLNRLIANFY